MRWAAFAVAVLLAVGCGDRKNEGTGEGSSTSTGTGTKTDDAAREVRDAGAVDARATVPSPSGVDIEVPEPILE